MVGDFGVEDVGVLGGGVVVLDGYVMDVIDSFFGFVGKLCFGVVVI